MYFQLLAFATHRVELTAERARLSCACFYGLLAICYLELPFIEEVHIDAKSYDVQLNLVQYSRLQGRSRRFKLPGLTIGLGFIWGRFWAYEPWCKDADDDIPALVVSRQQLFSSSAVPREVGVKQSPAS